MSHHVITIYLTIAFVIGAIMFTSGCTSAQPLINTTKSLDTQPPTITPKPTPNPFGLDSESYYIADSKQYYWEGVQQCIYANFSVTLKNNNITSGEFLVFDGTTTNPPSDYVCAEIDENMYGLKQMFVAPILPGANGTNLIKMKIPAMDIHIDRYSDSEDGKSLEREFIKNGTYAPYVRIGGYNNGAFSNGFTITSDPAHPMIIEQNPYQSDHKGGRWRSPKNVWAWTNSSDIQHVWDTYDPHYESDAIRPYPTYPRPNKTCLKHNADNSGDVLVVC